MSYMSDPMGYALDMYITGHYGEDQFRGEEEYEMVCDRAFGICVFNLLNQCPLDLECDDVCSVVKAVMKDHTEEQQIYDDEMEQRYIEDEMERRRCGD